MATVIGLFNQMDNAQRAVQALIDGGFRREDISVVARDERGEAVRQNVVGEHSSAAEGAGAGAVGGTVVGGAIGLLVGAGLLAIPGVGPVLAAGPLAAAIGTATATAGAGALGAGVGAATGGLAGGLIGAGVPEEDARYYTEGVHRGDVLVSVAADGASAPRARDLLRQYGADDMADRGSTAAGIYDTDRPVRADNDFARGERTAPRAESEPDFARGERDAPRGGADTDFARGMHRYDEHEGDYRSYHRSTYGANGRPYEDYAPAYRYGHTQAGATHIRGDRWEDVEPELRRDWERDHPNTWDEFKANIRYAWERARRGF